MVLYIRKEESSRQMGTTQRAAESATRTLDAELGHYVPEARIQKMTALNACAALLLAAANRSTLDYPAQSDALNTRPRR
jgi:hypothetical protein